MPPSSMGQHWTDCTSSKSLNINPTSPNLLKVYYANSRSICNKINELHILLSDNAFDILIFCEIWLTLSLPDSLLLNGYDYTLYRTDRINKIGGGVCIFHKNFIKSCSINVGCNVNDIELLCIDLICSPTKYRIITFPERRQYCWIFEFCWIEQDIFMWCQYNCLRRFQHPF